MLGPAKTPPLSPANRTEYSGNYPTQERPRVSSRKRVLDTPLPSCPSSGVLQRQANEVCALCLGGHWTCNVDHAPTLMEQSTSSVATYDEQSDKSRDGGSMQKYCWRSMCWRFAPPLLWMLIIGGLSTAVFSIVQTGRILMPILQCLLPSASPETLDLLHAVIRKGMHLLEFGVLALLWYRALSRSRTIWHGRMAVMALILVVSYAGLDEIHQLFVPGRTGTVMDVGWDSLGAAFALTVRHAIWRSRALFI